MSSARANPDAQPPFSLFVKPGCPWCREAEDYLTARGYGYERFDVIADPSLFAEMRELSGQTKAPTLAVGADRELVLADFGTDELEPFLAQHNL